MNSLTVSSEMRASIRDFLVDVEKKNDVRILYACESGSRAWGFASPDSDYDIRFIFTSCEGDLLKIDLPKDNIEIPIKDDLDAGGWDLRKSLSLLRKSNGALIEWLHSPIVYYEVPGFLDSWRNALKETISERALVNHYRGLAMQMWRGNLNSEVVRPKSYLYCLRAVLSAEWVIRKKTNPPVPFESLLFLLEDEVLVAVETLLEVKSRSNEKVTIDRVPVLDRFLETKIEQEIPADLTLGSRNENLFDDLFKQWTKRASDLKSVSDLNIVRVSRYDLTLFRCLAGSRAYGTDYAGSDNDYRGVFALPNHLLGDFELSEQVQDERGDDVYYELGKTISMLQKNNPNFMELLYMPEDCVIHKHPLWELIKPEMFLSKKCELSFANYAISQVKKARGLNKKIVNPEPEQRKELIDFCYVLQGQGSVSLSEWLILNNHEERNLGLVNCQHAPQVYSLYIGEEYRGIFSSKSSSELICSSVAIGVEPIAWMICNIDAYKKHCKDYKDYWAWVKNRNEDRYKSSNKAGYDAKNMMHTLRLLDVALEIAEEGLIRVRRPDRNFLMKVRSGELEYEHLLALSEEKMQAVKSAYVTCDLPDEPNYEKSRELLLELRAALR